MKPINPSPASPSSPVGSYQLADALSPPSPAPPVERLAYRITEVAAAFGVSRRTIERELAARKFPPADLRIGKCPLWRRSTLLAYAASGGVR
jgi:hypothetical protein